MSVRPVLKMLISPDLPDLETGAPADPSSFCVLVQALIGTGDDDAADTFDIVVCTLDRLPGEMPPGGVLSGRGYLFMKHWDYQRLRDTVVGWCERAEAPDWPQAAAILCRYTHWEYEDDCQAHCDVPGTWRAGLATRYW